MSRRRMLRQAVRGVAGAAAAGTLAACGGPFGASRQGAAIPRGKPAWATDGDGDKVIHLHRQATGEDLRIAYRQGRQVDRAAIAEISHFLRDDRTDEAIQVDVELVDLLYDVQIGSRTRQPLEVLSAFRSSETNEEIRRRGGGAARQSLHMDGLAADIRVKDTPAERIRGLAMELGRGGVGYYPKQRFVHLDIGPVRSWWA